MRELTFHLAVADDYRDGDPAAPYLPRAFAADGFIHCTDGAENLVDVANLYYRDDRRQYVVLVIEKALVAPPIRYDDPGRIYPHIYGGLNRDAIVGVLPAPRAPDGSFVRFVDGTPPG